MKSLDELVNVEDPAWPTLSQQLEDATSVVVLSIEPEVGRECLHRLQLSARSAMGALALHTAGLVVDNGWLRILGGGGHGMSDLATVNQSEIGESAGLGYMVVAFDVLGGRFAVNGGGLKGGAGEVHYWAPDALAWEGLDLGYSGFIAWASSDRLGGFYAELRWPGWAAEVASVALDEGLSVYPPLCTVESRPIESTTRRAVPLNELTALLDRLAVVPDGRFNLEFD